MKQFLKLGTGNPLTPFVLIFSLIILFTIIVTNIRNTAFNSQENEKKRVAMKELLFNPLLNTDFNLAEEEVPQDAEAPDTQMLAAAALADWSNGKFDEAEDKFRTILVFNPNNPIALSHLGALLHHRKNYKGAELMFRRQTLYFPGDPGAHLNLGAVLAKQNKFTEAIQASKRGLELDPSSPATALSLAKIYSLANNKKLSMDYFRRAAPIMGRSIIEASWDPSFDNVRELPEFKQIVRDASAGDPK